MHKCALGSSCRMSLVGFARFFVCLNVVGTYFADCCFCKARKFLVGLLEFVFNLEKLKNSLPDPEKLEEKFYLN